MNTVHFKEHSVVEKEKSSSYLSRFCCLDNVGHHVRRFGPLLIPAKGGGGREQNILQDTGLLSEETQRGQEHAVKAEENRRRVCSRSASPERKVRLGLSNPSSARSHPRPVTPRKR